jgi:hypothetical protein
MSNNKFPSPFPVLEEDWADLEGVDEYLHDLLKDKIEEDDSDFNFVGD